MENRIIFGRDLLKRNPETELQHLLKEDEFYMAYAPSIEQLTIVQPTMITIVEGFPVPFWEQATEQYPATRTIINNKPIGA